jgi:hypothetical protein
MIALINHARILQINAAVVGRICMFSQVKHTGNNRSVCLSFSKFDERDIFKLPRWLLECCE